MNERTKNWLKNADAVIIECNEDNINDCSLVSVSPYNTQKSEWLINTKREMLLKEAEKIKKRQIVKGKNLIKYYQSQIKKN